MLTAGRNRTGLTETQIEYCREAWLALCAGRAIALVTVDAGRRGSRTRFIEERG